MKLIRMIPLAAAALVAACAQDDPTAPLDAELVLAQQAQTVAQDEAVTDRRHYEGWLARLLEALRTTDNPEALACFEEAKDLHDQARLEPDRDAARELHGMALRRILCAILALYPDAAERTGLAVDNAVARIEEFLGDRDAPRIRRVLEHVKKLRVQAVAALEADDHITALFLNVRCLQILHRLVHHIRWGIADHDREAEESMAVISY